MIEGEPMANINEPKRFKIPSSSYDITANEATDSLLRARKTAISKVV